jgi:integrase/recombinase XerD
MCDAFCAYLTIERGLADNTVRSYVLDLELFARWFKDPIETADRAHVQKFLERQLASGASPQTVMRELFALRRFYNFLLDEETITKDQRHLRLVHQHRESQTAGAAS